MEMHVVAFIAIGGTLLFEGLIWAIFPGPTRQMYIGMLDQLDNKSLHLGGAYIRYTRYSSDRLRS
ncbi:DUF2065 family protein [Hellea sp.]|nr:DUF2065 family protein [Hellea sp.]